MPLLIAVAVALVVFVFRRVFFGRRLTIEQSVDQHRRTLSAVHDAATRAREGEARGEGPGSARPMRKPTVRKTRRPLGPRLRWQIGLALLALATVVTAAIVVAQRDEKSPARAAPTTTTTSPPVTNATTTTRAAPTTTVPLVTATDASGTAFTIGKPTYTLLVQTTAGDCWIEARDPQGASLFSGTLRSGQSQPITGSTFTLRLGNPGAVTLSVDGEPVAFSTADGSSIRIQFTGSPAAT